MAEQRGGLVTAVIVAATVAATETAAIAATETATVATTVTAEGTTGPVATAETTAITATVTTEGTAGRTVTRGAFFTRTGNVDFERTAHEILAFRLVCCVLGFLASCHGDKGETASAIGETIAHDLNLLHSAELAEKLLQVFFRGTPGEVTDE